MHDPMTCPDCDLSGLKAHLAMVLPLERMATDLSLWLLQHGAGLRKVEAEPLRQAIRLLALGLQTIHDRPGDDPLWPPATTTTS